MLHQDIKPKDIVAMLRRRWYLVVLLAFAGGGLGIMAARVLPKRFVSQTVVLVQGQAISADVVKPVVADNIAQRLAAMQQQILSRTELEPVIKQFNLYPKEVNKLPMADLVDRLRLAVSIEPVQAMSDVHAENLPGFYISVTYDDPKLAQQICARVTNMFLERSVAHRKGVTKAADEFLAKQLDDAKVKLDEQDGRLAVFQRRYLGSLPDQEQTNLNLLNGLTTQLDAATQALSRAQQDKSFSESVLAQQSAAAQESQAGQNPETLEQRLATMQAELTALQSKYTDDHPDVIKAKNDIAGMKQKIADSEQQRKNAGVEKAPKPGLDSPQIQQLRAQIHQYDQIIKERTQQQEDIQNQIKLYQGRVQASPAIEQEFKMLTRDHQSALDFYNDLLKKRDQSSMAIGLDESQEGEQFEVLDPANLPNKPAFPKPLFFAGGGFGGGLVLGLGLILLLELQDTSMRSDRDVEIVLHLPVLAMIPLIGADRITKATKTTAIKV
jgi:polysaccharide chain length determinant protein (PEP-CTERM system associated)